MTLYHFGNCLALVYAPYHMAYKFSGITEYATFSKCVYAGGLYIFTQLCKMLLLATFFPDSDNIQSGGEYDVFLEILKATVDLADLLGIYLALNSIPGKGHAKIFTAAIGWASAEVLVTRSVMLWVGARGSEFDWRYVRACAESNVALLQHAASAALVWLAARSDLPRRLLPATAGLLLLVPYRYSLGLMCQVLVTRSVMLWVGARGSEFDWRYVRACAESNVALLQHAASAALVWLAARSDLPRRLLPATAGLLLLVPYRYSLGLMCQVLVTRSVMLWVGARGSEFDWRYVRACAESNVALLQHAASAALVWLAARSDLPRRLLPATAGLLLLVPYRYSLGLMCQVLVTRSVMLWVGARGSEFDWRYVRACAESNVALLQHAASAALVWLAARSDLPRRLLPATAGLLLLVPYRYSLGLMCQVLVTRSVMLWVGARGSEFDWRYVRACAESNVALLQHAASAALVWLAARSDLPRRLLPATAGLLLLVPYRYSLGLMCQVLVTRSVMLWVGARGSEFDWRYVRACAESNVALLQHAASAALVWLAARSDLPRRLLPATAGLLLLVPYRYSLGLMCQVLVTRSVMLWVGARGSEFDWRYVRACAESNVALLQHAASAALVWLAARSDLPRRLLPATAGLLLLVPYRALVEDAIAHALGLSAWWLLALRACHALAVGLAALAMYATLVQQIGM